MTTLSRRELIGSAAAATALPALAAPARTPVIDSHIHLFEPARFPYHARASYRPPAEPLAPYLDYVKQSGIDHVIIVHPEPYQDDHRYLAYCFANENPRGLFKGTCLFDPLDPAAPKRMQAISREHPGRIVAIRIHAMNAPGQPFERTGPIRNRDLADPGVKAVWRAAAQLGMAVQMHFLPHHAPAIGKLAAEFKDVPVILDHMGRFGMGKPEDFDAVLALGRFPKTWFKFSGWSYSSKSPAPHPGLEPAMKRAHSAFGAERIIIGGLGHKRGDFENATAILNAAFAFAKPAERAAILGGNAAKLFGFA